MASPAHPPSPSQPSPVAVVCVGMAGMLSPQPATVHHCAVDAQVVSLQRSRLLIICDDWFHVHPNQALARLRSCSALILIFTPSENLHMSSTWTLQCEQCRLKAISTSETPLTTKKS
jgi:hypothetical protein